jgi:short-subunit dehydrogenase
METKVNYALVTGGTSGIGYELVRRLAHDGKNLVIVSRSEEDLARVADEITHDFGVDVITISKDLFDPENAFALYNEIRSRNIEIDILINDAGRHGYPA